jgi:hypothetical protein
MIEPGIIIFLFNAGRDLANSVRNPDDPAYKEAGIKLTYAVCLVKEKKNG